MKAVIIPQIISDFLYAHICRLMDQAVLVTIPEGAPKSLKFLKIYCLCRYFIDRHTDLERQFNINVDDGKITLAKLLDRETDMWHNITVTATEVSKLLLLTQQPPTIMETERRLPEAR